MKASFPRKVTPAGIRTVVKCGHGKEVTPIYVTEFGITTEVIRFEVRKVAPSSILVTPEGMTMSPIQSTASDVASGFITKTLFRMVKKPPPEQATSPLVPS